MLSETTRRTVEYLFPDEADRSAVVAALERVVSPANASAELVRDHALLLGWRDRAAVEYWAGISVGDGRDVQMAVQSPEHFSGGLTGAELASRNRELAALHAPPPPPGPQLPPMPAGERQQGRSSRPAATEAALLRAVLDAPDDDAPRLVYADWLEEHGEDHWAWAIRAHCATEPTRDTHSSERSQANDIFYEMREYLLAPLRELGFDTSPCFGPPDRYTNNPIGWGFRRGFVGGARVGEGDERARFFVERVEGVFRSFPIQHLTLGPLSSGESDHGYCPAPWSHPLPPITLETLGALLGHACLLRLRSLDLSGNGLDDRAAELLAATPNLAGLRQLKLGAITYYTGGYHGDTLPLTNQFSERGRARLEQRFGAAVTF